MGKLDLLAGLSGTAGIWLPYGYLLGEIAGTWVREGQPFHFSAVPYTPHELESALHKEELPPLKRTVVSVLGAIRGVGGIDSWGTDVEAEYQVSSGEDVEYGFVIRGGF